MDESRQGCPGANLRWAINPVAVFGHFRRHRYLLSRLAWRDVQVRYRGSWLGPLWALLTPLLMLAVYAFVFSEVFKYRWGTGEPQSRVDFALALFGSLTVFNLFAETLTAAPQLILANPNYVKRVVFPLEILPVARFTSNLVHSGFNFVVFLAAVLLFKGSLNWTLVFVPVVVAPLALLSLGCAFFLASLGVFVRDINNVVGLLVTMLMFMSAVFYPLSILPPAWQRLLSFNPLVPILEDFRRVTLQGLMPEWPMWCAVTVASAAVAVAGLAWFMQSKNAFADVV
jgi:lipopolysaccharide transport system permease protein